MINLDSSTPSLLKPSKAYKPHNYPWALEYWRRQQQIHWLAEEVPLGEDLKDWAVKLNDKERNLLTQIFRFFTQSDIEVNDNYMERYSRVFKPTEIKMMLAAFSNSETTHIAAYALLLETIGMPDSEFAAFLDYQAMRDKHDYMQKFGVETPADIARTLAMFGGFTEGLQLFASFAMLMNFPRQNKMKGMGQIVSWSIRDEAVSPDTEVLTLEGWQRIDSVDFLTTKVLEYNINNGDTSFTSAERKHVVRNKSFVFTTDNSKQHVTPGHRMIFEKDGEIQELKAEDFSTLDAREFASIILSGNKLGKLTELSEDHVAAINKYKAGEGDLQWVIPLLPEISKAWALAFIANL